MLIKLVHLSLAFIFSVKRHPRGYNFENLFRADHVAFESCIILTEPEGLAWQFLVKIVRFLHPPSHATRRLGLNVL